MTFQSKKHAIGAFIIAALVILSFSGEHPVGNTGAPGDSLCTSCHGGGGFTGSVNISGLPSTVVPDQTYNVTVTLNVSSGTPIRGGFQIVALQDANDSNAGDWTNNSASSSLLTSGGREYFGHKPFKMFGGGSSVEWDADWTAPNITDDVTFYAVGNFANGNGSTSGDNIMTGTETVTVQGTTPLVVDIVDEADVSCNNGDDGTATATSSGGTPPYSFSWDNGESDATAINLDAGNHTVTVTDDNGETGSASINIGEPPIIEIDPEYLDVSCFGDDDGEVILNASGGTGALECDWSNGLGGGCEQIGLGTGLYFVTITDANNCSIVEEIEINEPNPLMLNLSSTDESTSGASDGTATSIPNGGTSPYNFNWSNGINENGNGSTIEDLSAGMYSLTVTDQNGCEAEGSIMVMAGACALDANPVIIHIACSGDSTGSIFLNPENGSLPLSFAWSNGATTENLINIPAGIYNVEINDNAGCSLIVNEIMVEEPDSLMSHTIAVTNATCPDSEDGEIIINVSGGTSNYLLSWSNGVTNDTTIMGMDTIINIPDTLSNIAAGSYIYVLNDSNACMVTDTIIVSSSDTVPPILILDQVILYLDENGEAGPAVFTDVDAGSSDNCAIDSIAFETPLFTCDDLGFFDFPVELFDASGNSTIGMATVGIADIMPPVIDCSAIGDIVTNSCDPVSYNLPIATDNCVVEELVLVDGLPSGSNFPAGTSTVTYRAIDNCNNSSDCSFTVTVNIDLELSISVTNPECHDGSDGIIVASGTGGTEPYTFEISGEAFENLTPGTYTVSLFDSGNCSVVEMVVIQNPAPISVGGITTSDPSCFGENNGSINLDALPDSLTWDFTGDPTMLAAGDYEVTITNEAGCTEVSTYTIGQPEELGLENVILINQTCHDSEDCTIDFDIIGGTGIVTAELIPDSTLCNGTVTLNLKDENGCTFTTTFMLEAPEQIIVENSLIEPATDVNSGSITIDVSGGLAPYSYLWRDENGNDISTDQNIFQLFGGTYFLQITDSNGCVTALFEFFVDTDVATIDLDNDNTLVNMSPNPANQFISLDFSRELPKNIKVYNIKTELVSQEINISNHYKLDLDNYVSGVYIVYMEFENVIVVKRFVKL